MIRIPRQPGRTFQAVRIARLEIQILLMTAQFGVRRAKGNVWIGQVFRINSIHRRSSGDGIFNNPVLVLIQLQRRESAPGFVGVHFEDEAPLFQVILTGRTAGRFPGPGQRRQQNRRQDTDDAITTSSS